MAMENQHAKIMLDIEMQRNKQVKNVAVLEESLARVKEKETEIDQLQIDLDQKMSEMTRKQREFDIIIKKFVALKEIFDVRMLTLIRKLLT